MKNTPIAFALVVLISGCGSKISPELEQAKDVLSHFLAPMQLQSSMFAVAYPECKPSQFAAYILSPAGGAELPIRESIAQDEDKEMAAAIGMPLWPDGVSMVRDKPDPARGKQLVLKHDDAKNMLIIEAYDNPSSEPSAIYEWVLVKVAPTQQAKMVFEANAESGMSFGKP
jgi:hypothetical protein